MYGTGGGRGEFSARAPPGNHCLKSQHAYHTAMHFRIHIPYTVFSVKHKCHYSLYYTYVFMKYIIYCCGHGCGGHGTHGGTKGPAGVKFSLLMWAQEMGLMLSALVASVYTCCVMSPAPTVPS